jgi:hypothetical protein
MVDAGAWMGAARAADLVAVEVDLGPLDELDALGARIRRFKRDCRNAWWRWRRKGGFRSHSRAGGFCGIILGGGRWRLVARFVVDLHGAAVQPLAERLRRVWPSAKVQPVVDQPQAAGWCLPDFTSWPADALNWVNSCRNLQILRLVIQPVGARQPKSTRVSSRGRTVDAWPDEPLPVVF